MTDTVINEGWGLPPIREDYTSTHKAPPEIIHNVDTEVKPTAKVCESTAGRPVAHHIPVPTGYRVLIKAELTDSEEIDDESGLHKHKSGILLTADTVKRERHQQVYGHVVAIGPLAYKRDGGPEVWGVKVGTRVIFAKYAGTNVKHDGVTYVLLNDEDVLCEV